MGKTKILAAGLTLATISAGAGATTGYFSHAYGVKSAGMGGVGIALPQDGLAAASNPAGITALGNRFDIGATWFRPIRGASISGNAGGGNGDFDGSGRKDFLIPEFGYVRQLSPTLAAGLAVYGNGGMNTTYEKGVPLLGGSNRAGVDLAQIFVSPSLAYRFDKHQSVGVALNLAYQRFKAEGLQNFGGYSASPADLTDRGYDSSTGFGVRLGWSGEITPGLTLGATWSSRTRMGNFDKYKGLFAQSGGFDIPENYGLGVAFKPGERLTLAADVQRIRYSSIGSVGNPLARLTVSGQPLGSNSGAGFGWRDMTVYKLGVAYELNPQLTLRAGLVTGKQAIPAGETLFNVLAPGVVEDHLTLGATWTLADRGEISLGYTHAFRKTVSGSASIPAGFGGGEADLWMKQDSLGVSYGRPF